MISIDKEVFLNMIDSDKIVSLNSLVEHTDMSVLKNIVHVPGGPSSIACTGKTICYPNKTKPKKNHKITIKKRKIPTQFELKTATRNIKENSDSQELTQGPPYYFILFHFIFFLLDFSFVPCVLIFFVDTFHLFPCALISFFQFILLYLTFFNSVFPFSFSLLFCSTFLLL